MYEPWAALREATSDDCPWLVFDSFHSFLPPFGEVTHVLHRSCLAGYYSTGADCLKCNTVVGKWSSAKQTGLFSWLKALRVGY